VVVVSHSPIFLSSELKMCLQDAEQGQTPTDFFALILLLSKPKMFLHISRHVFAKGNNIFIAFSRRAGYSGFAFAQN
jgi:hypothetical protein